MASKVRLPAVGGNTVADILTARRAPATPRQNAGQPHPRSRSVNPFQALLDAIATIEVPAEAQRVFHGRGGLFPGCEQWSLDYFTPV